MSQIEDFLGGKPSAGSQPTPSQKQPSEIEQFLGERPKDNALVRGWKSMTNSAGITKDLAAGDAAAVARRVKEFDDYNRANPGSQQGQELSKAWEQGDGIIGGIKGVAGEIAKDWKEAPNWMGAVRSAAGNAKAMGEGLVAQVPNMLAPMAGMVAGGAAGSLAGPVGTAAGAWAGASAGNTLVEGGGMLMDRLNKAGINPQDTAAVEKFTREQGDAALGDAAIKGGIIGAVDAATAGLAGKILNAPARAAADRALAQMGVDAADKAAVKTATQSQAFKDLVANDAAYKAASTGASNVARNVGAAALDPAGEFTGEFVGQGVATGDWDTKNAALEAISSMGQSALMYGGQKAYQAATSPLRGKGDGGAATPEAAGDETQTPLMLSYQSPDRLISFPDGSVGRVGELDTYLASLPEDQRADARAKIMGQSIREVNDPQASQERRWWDSYRDGGPQVERPDYLAEAQQAVRVGTQFTDQQAVDMVRNAMEDAWLDANVRNEPASAVQTASAAGQQLGQEIAGAVADEAGATAAVDAQVRTSRILSGLQNAMDSGSMGSAQSINYLNEALTRIGEQPLAQDEVARARRLLDAHAAFTGQTTPAPLPGDLAAQNPLVDRFADNAAMEAHVRRSPSERLGVNPANGPLSKTAAMAVDAAAPTEAVVQPLTMQNPLLAPVASATPSAAPAASPFNVTGDFSVSQANQAQQSRPQPAQAGGAQAAQPAIQPGLSHGGPSTGNDGAQENAQNAAQGQAQTAGNASKTGASIANVNGISSSNAGKSEFDATRDAINSEATRGAESRSEPMTIGSTPKTGDAVSVRDGVVFLGGYEALDYDSGEPITVPAGATRGQVAQALRDGGVLTDRQKVFGLKDREHESMDGAGQAQAAALAPAVQVTAPAAPATVTPQNESRVQTQAAQSASAAQVQAAPAAADNPKQQKAIERIQSEKGAFFFSKPKAEAFLADNGLQDGYEVVQQQKAFVIKAKQAQAATENVASGAADQTTAKQAPSDNIAGRDLGEGWAEFTPESGTKAVPRAEMPQIKAEHRGAMVNFMNARGVAHEEATVPAGSLKPTQREFSREKVEKAKAFTGGNRAILTSSDGHVLDGHHQWMAARENGEDVRTIRLDAPIDELVKLAHDFPSSTVADGATEAQAKADQGEASKTVAEPASQTNADFIKALAEARKELPAGFEITPMGDTISLKENGKFAINGLGRNRAGVEEALRQAKQRDAQNKAQAAAPEQTRGEKTKPRLAESADALWKAIKDASNGVVTERGIRYPVMEVVGGDWFMLDSNGRLKLIDRGAASLSYSEPTDVQIAEFHDALEKDQVQVRVMARGGYESDYKNPKTLQILHSPSGMGFKSGGPSVIEKLKAARDDAERAERGAATKKAAEQEARKASREVERDLFRQLTAANGGMVGKSLEQVTDALKQQMASRDASTALNPVQISRLARAIHKNLQGNAEKLSKDSARDPAVKSAAISEGLDNLYGEVIMPEQIDGFVLGFEHALSGKTKSSLSGPELADMVKGYESATAWIGTEEGAAWFEGKRRKKLENTGVDLRRHWEAMKAQMKADESDMQKAWKQIEAATNRAELFAPYLPEGSKPGWVAYVTQLRSSTKTFKQFMFDSSTRWYGSSTWGRGGDAQRLQFVLDGKRYPGDLNDQDRYQWQNDPVYRMQQLREAAELYIEKVQKLTAFLDGATSVKEAAERFVDTMVAEQHQAKARTKDAYFSNYENIANEQIRPVLSGVHGVAFDAGVWNDGLSDFAKLRVASGWTETLIEKEATLELPSRAMPLTPPKLDRVERAMPKDHRGGKDVTPEQFKAKFGFADVGFGNWVGAKNDQDHLNYAYDAFMDLAEHFGFAPKNIGLGGALHFTIGALGHGKFSAHFSPNHPGPNGQVQVINLTNTRGDGTVYHEWAHALDHNLGGEWKQVHQQILNALKFKAYEAADWERVARNFLVGGSYWHGSKNMDKVDAAIQGLRYYGNSASRRGLTTYKNNADKLGKDYWGNDAELFARAIEAWSADSLGGTNSYLLNQDWAGDGKVTQAAGYRGTPYPTGGERALFAKYMTALAKSVKFTDGKPTVTLGDFEKNLPEDMGAGEVRRKELLSKEGMQAYYDQVLEEKAMAAEEKARRELEAQAAEKAKVDALAEQVLADMEALNKAATVDGPSVSESRGPLTADDLSAIFDEAVAELREETQEQPNVPATFDAPVASASATTAGAARVDGSKDDKSAAKLIAEAAKLGVTGANEALSGLAKLFGGSKGGRLNSFPAGFDEETYKAAKPHFKAALTAFQEAGKSLKDLFKLLIQNFGDGVKEYAIQFAKDEGLTAQLGKAPAADQARSPSAVVADWVKGQLARGEADGSFDWRALFEQADAAFGGTQAEGKYTPKDAYDAMEAGVNQFILSRPSEFNPNASQDAAHIIVERLHRLTQMLPTQSKRTAEQDEFQQFSTVPALAYAANWAANMNSADTMLEPSAGIGGLAAFAKNAGAKLILNELSSRRAAVLREVFPAATVFTENAEQIDNILPANLVPSVVVMNPPFSATAGRIHGKRDTQVGAQHVEQGLKRLADGGRLVAIVGEGMNLDRPAFADWWKNIRAKYDVRAVIPMDGSGYAKYGTTFDNAILVIDKVKPSGRPIVTTPAKNYSELIGSLAEIRNDRPESLSPSHESDGLELDAAEQALAESSQAGGGSAQPGQSGRDDRSGVGGAESGRGQVLGAGSGGRGVPRRSAQPGRAGGEPGASRGGERDNPGRSGDAAAPGGSGSDAAGLGISIEATEQASDPSTGLTDSIFESYQPQRLKVPGAKPHPGPLVQSSAMAAVLPPVPTYTPNLPKETIEKGLLSVAQIEAVVYAGQAHQEFLEPVTVDGKDVAYRRGFFIGDGTGVGKGREISGIILDNLRQGREKAVWISEKPGLLADAQRDFGGVGGDPKQIFNVSKTKAEEQINADKGIAFLSYATLRSGAKSQETTAAPTTKAQFAKQFPKGLDVVATKGRGTFPLDHIDPKEGKVWVMAAGRLQFMRFESVESIDKLTDWQSGRAAQPAKGSKKEGQSRLDQLVNWLGKDFDGVLAFDEAHNAGNATAQKSSRGQSQPAAQALAVVELQKRLPNARVVYVSATGATQVSNLSFATRLGLWGPATPFASVQNFIAEMTDGGLAAMELVARDLKQMGAYMARSLSFEGVTYSRVEHQLSQLQQDIYNRLAEAWQVTLQNIDEALKATGAVGENGKGSSSAKSAAMSAYWGAQQRFFSQVITSMQMPSVLEQMERDLADGKALVLQLVNTNEAQQNRSIAKRREEDESADLEELDLTPRDVLMQMVEKSFPVTQFEAKADDSGKIIRVPAKDSEVNPVINREAVAMRDALLTDLKDIRVPDGPLEIVLNHFGVDKVAEVTGRTQRVVRKLDKAGELKAQLESRGPASARADANAFMADQKQILVFSDAGGTGYSFHADNTQKNKRKRSHYLIQPGWRADKAVQGFGRTHRTNQASAPHYFLASTNVPSQKRFLSAIARRLDQLGALTKGQRDTANQGMFSEKDNLESIYATQAVQQFFKDGQHQQLEGISFQEFLRQTGLENIIDEETNRIAEDRMPDTRTFLNRMLSLKLDMQEKVFDAFMLRMEEKVEMAVERGEFDAGLQTIRALESRIVADDLAYTDPRSGAETRLVELELTQPATIYPFPDSLQKAEYVVNEKSGKVYAKSMVGKTTTKEGAIVDRYRFYGTGSVQSKTAPEIAKGYRAATKAEAMKLWAAENDARPKTYKERKHMIVGAMLPIWDRLKTDGSIQVARTMTVDGNRLLGRLIDKKSLPDVRKRLNVASAASKMTPGQVMAQILKGDKAELANGWSLERARVSDDLRIELKSGNGNYISPAVRADLVRIGLVNERISWNERLFVPTGAAGVPVLERLTKNRPVVELQSEQDTSDAHFGAKTNGGPLDTFPAEFMAELSAADELFAYPMVHAASPDAALRQVDPTIKLVGDVTAEDERSESGADTKLLFRTGNGRDFYVFEKGDELWLDVSRLGEGDGGSAIYSALMDYAATNDKVFIGDPAGLSDIAMRRRLEAMISSAIKRGSTDHMEPHARQVEGDAKLGVPALKWRRGDTIGNIQRMIDVSLAALESQVPDFKNIRYDFATGIYRDAADRRYDFGDGGEARQPSVQRGISAASKGRTTGHSESQSLFDGADSPGNGSTGSRAPRLGRRTLKRGILLNSLLRTESSQRPGLLERALRKPSQLVGEQAKRIFYKGADERVQQQVGSRTDRAVMDMVRESKSAADILGLIASTSKTPFNRKVALLLGKTGAAPTVTMGSDMGAGGGFTFLAKYSRKNDELTLSEGAAGQAEQIFLHEMIHAATLKSLDRKGMASLQMRKLYEHVKKQGGAAGTYGMKNVGEFVAEAFTNPGFQRALRQMNAPAGNSLKTAWDAFVRILKTVLGLPAKSDDALSRALELGVQVMREDKALRRMGAQSPAKAAVEDNAHFGVGNAAEAAKNIGQGLKSITATNVKKAGSHKLTDWLKMGLQFLGRRQLVDIYGDVIPLAEYDRLVAQMEADKNDVGAEADELAHRWGKLKDDVQLSELMHDATLAEIDADSAKDYVEGDNKPQSAALKRRFDALSPEAKAVYREARDHYREHYKQVRTAIKERIMRAELSSKKRQELLEQMDADFFGYTKGVYFPLARFGQYVVATKDGDGKVISVSRAETMTEAEAMRDEMRKAFPAAKGFSVGKVTLSKDFVATNDMVGRGFMTELFAALDKHEIPADQRAELEDTIGQLYLSSLPDLSWAKHGIHRKGTPGFSQDARRAFAQNSFHGARYLAKLRYSDLMALELENMQKHVDTMAVFKDDFDQPKAQRVVDEMQKRHESLMNPKTNSLSSALTSFGFIFHLGLSPAAAMVNLSQTALVAYPVMGAKWGFQKSAAALLRASNESVKGKNDIRTQLKDKDELAAYDEAVRSGVIDVTMAHDLAGISQGEDAGVMWKLRPVMRAASFLFHHAERFNRQATFIAAYRLARDAGTEHHKAYEEAVKATYDGHFDYGSANRPRVMQGNVARVVLLFKQFAQNMIYTLGRNAYMAAKGDKQALKTFAGVVAMHAAGAGVLGLPLVAPLLALASALGGDDDDPWDAEVALRNMLADVFGQKASEVIAKGFSRLTPWDISGRIGLDNLIFPDIREGVEGKMWAQEMATGLLGPVVGIGINAARGAQSLAEGDYMRGLENMMPVVPRNAIKSARFLQEGAKDASGIVVKDDVSALGIAGQLVGFSPSEVRLAFEGRTAVMNHDRRLNVRRSELLGKFAHAVMKQDSETQAEAREEIKAFNERNPGRRITNPQMWQSVRARQRRIDQAEDGVYLPRNRRDAMDAGDFAF